MLILLENGTCQFGTGAEPVLATMQRLHQAVGVVAPPPEPSLDLALETPLQGAVAADSDEDLAAETGVDRGADADEDLDAAMAELDSAESGDDEALMRAAKRLRQSRSKRLGLVTKTKGRSG